MVHSSSWESEWVTLRFPAFRDQFFAGGGSKHMHVTVLPQVGESCATELTFTPRALLFLWEQFLLWGQLLNEFQSLVDFRFFENSKRSSPRKRWGSFLLAQRLLMPLYTYKQIREKWKLRLFIRKNVVLANRKATLSSSLLRKICYCSFTPWQTGESVW